MSLVPTIYTTLRVFLLGNMPGDWSYSIAGQLSWVNLIYEVVSEAIILPLFYFTGQTLMDKKEFANRIKTGAKLILSVGLDMLLVSDLSCSAKLGVNGIGYSKMVNMVGEQGTYWVANNFIWGWLLLPILSLGDLIKKETATDKNAVKNNTIGYFTMTAIVIVVWCALIPVYKPFMSKVLNYSDVDHLFKLVMVLFGIGNAFDTVVSFGAYVFFLKRNKINKFC